MATLRTILAPIAAALGLFAAGALLAAAVPSGGPAATSPVSSPAPTHLPPPPPSPPESGYRYVHHPVSTGIAAAQSAFDRGLTLVFAYQMEESEQAFREAARLDPTLAMAWWGIGLSLGPYINEGPDRGKTATAADALTRAKELARRGATDPERDYIAALEPRYSHRRNPDFDGLAGAYRDSMRALVRKYPDDPDATALFAEAIMDLRPWRLWDAAGNPEPGTAELVEVLERGLRAHPDHMGLLHFYIHAVEASTDPARALPAARRLAAFPMEPAAAHLVHMPAHIFMRVGDWQAAVEANEHATHHALDYRLSKNPKALHACGHCADFLSYAYMMQGNQAHARKAAEDYRDMTGDPTNAIAVLLRFRQWHALLSLPEPARQPEADARNVHVTRGYWRFARGMGFVRGGQMDQAQRALEALLREITLAPPTAKLDGPPDVEHVLQKISQAQDAADLKIAAGILGSRIAEARHQMEKAIDLLREAVKRQDEIPYGEPPPWFYPVRESLGGLLLRAGSPAAAEASFREDLRHSSNNPRSLLGLSAALQAQGRTAEAAEEHARFQAAWRYSDTPLTSADL